MKTLYAAAVALAMATPVAAFDLGDRTFNTNSNRNANLNANANSNRNNNANLNSNRNTNTQGQGQAQGQAQGQGQNQSISGNNSAATVNVNDRLQAPSMGGMGMSSGHPCAYGGNSFVLSIVGGGASYGGNANRIDDACMLGQLGYGQAAMAMIASRNPDAARALQAAGIIAPAPAPATVSSRSTPAAHYSDCKTRADGALLVKVARGGDKATAIAQCKAVLSR